MSRRRPKLPGRRRAATPEGLVPAAEAVARARREASSTPEAVDDARRELLAQRERLTERFALLQADLGGTFYEMAIRDHVRMDVLTRKAAELQRVDAELEALERALRGPVVEVAVGACPSCATPYGEQARFCSSCGAALGDLPAPASAPSHRVNGTGSGH